MTERAVLLAPVTRSAAVAALRRLRLAAVLAGTRGQPPADLGAIADAVTGLSRLARDLGDALDINPLLRPGRRRRPAGASPPLDSPAAAALDQPPGVAHGQRDDRLHRVDADRAGEDAGIGHEQPGHAVELPEAADHAAPGVLAHARSAHQVNRVQLGGACGYRSALQPPRLVRAADRGGAVEGAEHTPGAGREQR